MYDELKEAFVELKQNYKAIKISLLDDRKTVNKDETKEIEEDDTDGKWINPRKTRKGKVFSSPEKKSEVFECIQCRKKLELQQKFKEVMETHILVNKEKQNECVPC